MSEDIERENEEPEQTSTKVVVAGKDEETVHTPVIPIEEPGDSGFQKLDPLGIKLWRLEGVISTGIIFAGAIIGGSALWRFTPVPGWVILVVWSLFAALLYLSAVWFPPRKYASWSYRLSEQVLELRYGVFWQTSVMIPLTRLQHVDLKRGPLDRRFGLASLEVHTAGTSQASHEIPFLAEVKGLSLREQLIAAADLYVE
jgi:membrane protein YdbS with pleckstrin-like domain